MTRSPETPSPAPGTGAGDLSDRLLALVGKPGGPLEDASLWSLELVTSSELTPTMRRIELHAAGLANLQYRPGQDLMLRVPTDHGTVTNRRYTIRDLDRGREVVTVDVLLHGHGPGSGWASTAQPSDRIDAIGPRGKVWAQVADSHVFLADESAVPATLAMIEDLPAGVSAVALLDVASATSEQPLLRDPLARIDLRWLPRDGEDAGGVAGALEQVTLPAGNVHAYVNGEAHETRALTRSLVELGFPADRIATKSYWSRGRANADHGEPPRDEG